MSPRRLWGLLLVLLVLPGVARAEPVEAVFELFTSQGCSACPAAEAEMASWMPQPGVLVLGFHVDYWDQPDWKDPFSAPFATSRQRDYADNAFDGRIYTPELVVNGVEAFPGFEHERALAARARHVLSQPLEAVREKDDILLSGPAAGRVYLVGYEETQSQTVVAGENAGRKLLNVQPVRQLLYLGGFAGGDARFSVPEWVDLSGLKLAVLVQKSAGGPIVAAARL